MADINARETPEFGKLPPSGVGRPTKYPYDRWVEELKKRPGEWAIIADMKPGSGYRSLKLQLKRRGVRCAARNGHLWACYEERGEL